VEKPAEPSNIVAKIGDYTVTREGLEKKLVSELRASPDEYIKEGDAVDVEAVLLKMIAEKAMIIDAREQNLLEDGLTASRLKQFRERKLVNLLLRTELQDKVKVSESEIEERIKANPKLNRRQARLIVERAKGRKLTEQFYEELYEKLHVQKLSANFLKAARIRKRLLLFPKEPQRIRYVRKKQVKEELKPKEKNIVLATFDNGKVTLEDWFYALCQPSPPDRPKNLHTAEGVEQFLDKILMMPVFVAEAKSRGLDKDENFVKTVKKEEDKELLRMAVGAKLREVKTPAKEEITLYFNENKEKFRSPDRLKIDQIWCPDQKTAKKVKEELSGGKDFKSVKQEYSSAKKEKASNTSAGREGMFFKELWNSEPNEIVGPIKGFYLSKKKPPVEWQIKWRIVKILGKKPGKKREYSSDMEREVQNRMVSEQRTENLAKYRKELLGKYPYEIYSERIKDIDPLNIP
jgi:peptidyl-prolyl cis-trans isomerase C